MTPTEGKVAVLWFEPLMWDSRPAIANMVLSSVAAMRKLPGYG